MTRLISLALVCVWLAAAGPLKTVTYPVVHPVKTVHGLFQAVKFLIW